jgi:pimeloyl-ACP methyl ester carboxylesterase
VARSVFKSEQGRQAIIASYEEVLARAAARLPLRRHTVETALGPTHVVEAGADDLPPLLLLHGTASNSATWLGDIPRWSTRFRAIAADIVGEPGLSADRRLTLASDEPATWLASLLDALAVDRVRIVGMSLGGWIGLHFAVRHPGRVAALSLISTSGLAPQKRSFLLYALSLALLGDWGMRRVNQMVCGDVELPADALAFMSLVGRHFRPLVEPVPVFNDDELRRLSMPLQLFAGGHDLLVHTRPSVERIKRVVPHAEAHLLEDRGHVIVDQGDEILRFLSTARA